MNIQNIKIEKKLIYNELSQETLNDRMIIGGNPSGIINFSKVKYQWASETFDLQLANTWFPAEVQMTGDAKDYKLLSEPEKRMYDLVLSQLIFMDSLQTNNLMDNINPFITAPEVNACLSRQAFEEALHSKSYQVMVDSISENTDEIYEMWRVDKKLSEKNSFIASILRIESLIIIPQVTTIPIALIKFRVCPVIHKISNAAATSMGISANTISGCRKLSN